MKYKLTLFLSLPFTMLLAQTSDHHIITTQGDVSKGESMTMNWTIGDLVTEAAAVFQAILTQGFQQPSITVREIATAQLTTEIKSRSSVEFSASVYPNPVGTDLNIEVENGKEEYYLDLYDPAGNLISSNRSSNSREVIHLDEFPAAQYVLRISLIATDQSKVFQIIKAH
jgi:hypothetical protein